MTPQEAKARFALDPSLIFLNHGSFGARPQEVLEAQDRIRRSLEASPVEFLGRSSSRLLEEAMAPLAAYLGASPQDLAFVTNATTGVGIAAASIRLGPGDEVLGTDHEYGACAQAWKRACAASGAAWREFSVPLPWAGDGDFLARLEAALGPRTRVLFLSHITSPTALRFPVEAAVALARSRGILTVVDGAHAPGQIGLDLDGLGADIYVGNCHKWLCAPLGSAFVHVRRNLHSSIVPPTVSWGLVAEAEGGSAHDGYVGTTALSRRLRWLGTRDPSAFLAVPAALDFTARHAGPEDARRCAGLALEASTWAARRFGLPEPVPGGQGLRMALLPLPPWDGARVKAELYDRYRIEAPVTTYGGQSYLRVSFHCYNDEEDLTALVRALSALAESPAIDLGQASL